MITYSDDGPDFEPDDPLAVIMRPPSEHLAPPPGRFEEIRRGAARRRILRAVAGAGATCTVAALLALPLLRTAHHEPASPAVPLAPPPASSPTTPPAPAESAPVSVTPRPSARPSRSTAPVPTRPPAATASPSAVPSTAPTQHRPWAPTPRSRTAAPSTHPARTDAAAASAAR
ncbi:hypothetical protein AB0E10_37840 [Streptomyces sp. NPDC048045]|uniref:hypothetical protein n=1 Tax=Streptomyces sp. NPDC048045 TaxID=3154710 RepID=UPI003427A4C6